MTDESRNERCESLVIDLLSIKRGEVNETDLVEKLEGLKNKIDAFIHAIEFNVPEEYTNGC